MDFQQLSIRLDHNNHNNDSIHVIVINPDKCSVAFHKITPHVRSLENVLKGSLARVHLLPNGDRIYALKNANSTSGCIFGGSSPIMGCMMIVGHRRGAGLVTPKCSIDVIRQLVEFL